MEIEIGRWWSGAAAHIHSVDGGRRGSEERFFWAILLVAKKREVEVEEESERAERLRR
jgi:hypothetical protein